ncbi:MAG: hypothetical protein IKV61_01200 [Clostridia bacterium]|nr:hypothetical protein [Clostridia bacterium]
MINIIYGPKGFGKTKIILDQVDRAGSNAKGNVVFITDKRISTVSIDFNVRCVYTEDYNIDGAVAFNGFVNGLLAGNSDIEYVFIDGFKRIIGNTLDGAEDLFKSFEALQKEYPNLKFVVSVSSTREDLPEYIAKYID